eukprot:CAMPEP_0202903870 /NCGR_PEP_ID=MMETSP1392-20130828/26831_1 /ASSEMBLY_ACC=CAM_ASM_000868 /TAXON_ID=225041 /ORGANISM="Chlamydomonas chlamydogama, Strain SAG 11-48b" /LENGTH=71 /DNA_ID=CAMNT_0049591225 /DNA_START=110 /DNA_END=322 /DNA_ORIENTATION=-
MRCFERLSKPSLAAAPLGQRYLMGNKLAKSFRSKLKKYKMADRHGTAAQVLRNSSDVSLGPYESRVVGTLI